VLTKGDRRWRSSAGDRNGGWWRTPAAGRGGILHGKVGARLGSPAMKKIRVESKGG
jgi:hypothetical protein